MSKPKPLPWLPDLAPYVGGESEIEGQATVIKLASNEGAFGPSPKAMESYAAATEGLYRYPDGDYTKLRDALAKKHNLDAKRIVVGSGSDELIYMLCRCYLAPGDEIIYTAHGFAMYPIYARATGATLVAAPETNLTADVDAIVERAGERTKLMFLANPNNPTGTYISAAELQRLRDGLPEHVILVVDAAYTEYVSRNDYSDGLEMVHESDNVVMLRTFSKIYGLGGVRLGWGYFPLEIADILNRVRSPFNVSVPAQAAGIGALQDDDFVKKSQEHNEEWRRWTTDQLRAIGLTVPDSVCNFVLVRFPEDGIHTAGKANEALQAQAIIARQLGGYGLPDGLRISIGLEYEMRKVVDTLTAFMATT